MRVAISGSRSIDDKQVIREAVSESPHTPFHGEVLVGDAKGVDEKAKEYFRAFEHVEIVEFEADWDEYGRSAGIVRNQAMIAGAEALIAIWDGESAGTQDAIEKAIDKGIDVYIKVVETEDGSVMEH